MSGHESRISDGRIRWHQGTAFISLGAIFLFILGLNATKLFGLAPGLPWPLVIMPMLFLSLLCYLVASSLLPLKDVWLGERGMRLANSRTEIMVPYEAVASIRERRSQNPRIVTVRLRNETIFGRKFTFVPHLATAEWFTPWRETEVVQELRERVAAANLGGKKVTGPIGPPSPSIMADRELDGTF